MGEPWKGRGDDVLPDRQIRDDPFGLAVLGEKGQAVLDGRTRRVGVYGLPVDLHGARLERLGAEDRLSGLRAAGAEKAGEPDDLAPANVDGDALWGTVSGELVCLQHRLSGPGLPCLMSSGALFDLGH